jgi:hypothetical protein
VHFPFTSRLPSWPPPSRLSIKWARAVRFVFLPRQPTITSSSRHLRPPRAAQPPTSRCQARSSFHALIPSLISLLNPSSSRPAINVVKAITVDRFPLPCPGVPLPGHYKWARSTPGHHHTHLALNRLLLSSQRPLHRAPPPPIVPHHRPVMSDPPPPPLAADEAHLRLSPFFLNRGEVPRTGMPFRPFSGEPSPGR